MGRQRGKAWLSYNSPDYLLARHGFPPELTGNIVAAEALARSAAEYSDTDPGL